MYFFDCQADFDVDNVQRRELVNVYGVERDIRVIIIIMLFSVHGKKETGLKVD